ncbi:MAG: hypothetical protein VKK32_01460 [Candidatus Melainabacteria bacterium]|nr:hypothetical protein [Candidatus Melainabacteria bacterium]
MCINVTNGYNPPPPSRQHRIALNDLHDILGQIAQEILKAEKRRKELEIELRSAQHTSCRVNNRDLIPYLSSHADVVDHAIYEWFGENPKGKINRESFERQMGTAHNSSIINKTYFKRKPEYSRLEPLKKSNPATISHEGMGLDQAAQSIISEHLNQDSTLQESKIMEAICNFMIKYPKAGLDFRREVRDLIEKEKRTEHHELIDDLKNDLKQTVSKIKEKYDFAQLLLRKYGFHKNNGRTIGINKITMSNGALFHRISSEKDPEVRQEMLRRLHRNISNNLALT